MSESDPVRVLVVDDNRSTADQLGDFFDFPGMDVRVAYSAFQALQQVDFEPQLILIDNSLGDLNVYDLARAFRDDPCCECAVIVNLVDWQNPGRPPEGGCPVDTFLDKQVLFDLPIALAEYTKPFEIVADLLPIVDLQEELQRLYPRLRPRKERGNSNGSPPASDQHDSSGNAADGPPLFHGVRIDDDFLEEVKRCIHEDPPWNKVRPPQDDQLIKNQLNEAERLIEEFKLYNRRGRFGPGPGPV